MSVSRVSAGSAALLLSGLTVFMVQAPAYAQAVPDCTGVLPTASPPQTAGALSDVTVVPGQTVSATSGAGKFTPGSTVEYGVQPPVTVLGTVVVAADGSATTNVAVPDLPNGDYTVFFRSVAAGVTPVDTGVCVLPFTFTQPTAVLPIAETRPAARPAALPFSGANGVLPLTLGGVALVAVGAGLVVVTRKRKRAEVTPTSLA